MENNFTLDQITLKVCECRGAILNQLIYVERLVDEFLSRYFCSDETKKRDLFQLILATKRITFDSKKTAFAYIVKNRFSKFTKDYPNFLGDFEKIIPERNIMAHYLLDTSPNCEKEFNENLIFNLVNFEVKHHQESEIKIPYTVKPYDINELKTDVRNINEILFIINIQRVLIEELLNDYLPISNSPS